MSHTIPCLGINVWLRAMVLSQSITLDSHGKILTKKNQCPKLHSLGHNFWEWDIGIESFSKKFFR